MVRVGKMGAIFLKEVAVFFGTLTGYVVGAVFLLLVGLGMWVLPSGGNVLDTGQATLDTLFQWAPWVFLFLVPGVTMRMLAEERREGTLEQLLGKPVRLIEIATGKFLAAWVLVVLILLPTLVFFWSVYHLGAPRGSVDVGASWGSYLGLLLLGGSYAAVGILCSSLSRNAIFAFVLAALLSLFIYQGFAQLSLLPVFGRYSYLVAWLGVEEHYHSISRGVVDSRDLLYFASIIALALAGTVVSLRKRRG